MTIANISPTKADLGSGHFMVSSAMLDDSNGRCHVHTDMTSTNKLSGFHGQTKMFFFGDHGQTLAAPGQDFECDQAPIFGAAHSHHDWDIQAPAGTQGFGMAQFWHPHWPLGDVGNAMGSFFTDLGKAFNDFGSWLGSQQGLAVVFVVIVVVGTALCLAGVIPSCMVVFTLG